MAQTASDSLCHLLIALPGLMVLGLLHSPGWWLMLAAGVLFYCGAPYRRLQSQLTKLSHD